MDGITIGEQLTDGSFDRIKIVKPAIGKIYYSGTQILDSDHFVNALD